MKELNCCELTEINGGSELSDAICYLWGWIVGNARNQIEYCSEGNMAAIVAYK